MESDNPQPRKLRFAPKLRNRRKTKSTVVPKTESVDDDNDSSEARQLLVQRFNERRRQQPRVENSPMKVMFTNIARQSTTKSLHGPLDGGQKMGSELDLMQLDEDIGQLSKSSSSTAGSSVASAKTKDVTDDTPPKIKNYTEPWDHTTSYCLTTVPWRMPYSGDPEILDEAEFGEAASEVEYDETTMKPASELGFLNPDETGKNEKLIFFQFPQSLPAMKRLASAKGKEVAGSLPSLDQKDSTPFSGDGPSFRAATSLQTCSLEDLSTGKMGKLLVYKSGAVKLKLGETQYDVSPGTDCSVAQDVAAVNTKEEELCVIGGLEKRAIVTPDIDYILDRMIDLG